MQSPHPKIVYNEECIDLRENFEPVMNNRPKKNDSRDQKLVWKEHQAKDNKNEVVNTALKKLAKTYKSNTNAHDPGMKPKTLQQPFMETHQKKFSDSQDGNFLKSKSELTTLLRNDSNISKTISPSSPIIPSSYEKGDFFTKIEPYKNKFTMTKEGEPVSKDGKKLVRDKSLEKLVDKLITEKPSISTSDKWKNPVWNDRRLVEKYSLLKVPWKRSYTLPEYSAKTSMILKDEFRRKLNKFSDKKTYLYDDGSDIDSFFYSDANPLQRYFGYAFQSQLLTLLNISAYLCALLVLSLIIWFISGNKLFYNLLMPKPPEHPVKQYVKYVGGGIIYTITSIVKFIGSIFTIPTQQVYHPPLDHTWPPIGYT